MYWKALLTAIIILLLGALLISTETGRNFVDYFTGNMEKLTIGLSTLLNWPSAPSGEYFSVMMTTSQESFFGQAYQVENATLISQGVCHGGILLNDIILDRNAQDCKVNLYLAKGKFEYTSVGTIRGDFEVSEATIDGYSYRPSEKMNVFFEIIPSSFTLTGLNEPKISFSSVSGNLEKIKPDGSTDQLKILDKEDIELYDFLGNLGLSNSKVILKGISTKVVGSDFNWVG